MYIYVFLLFLKCTKANVFDCPKSQNPNSFKNSFFWIIAVKFLILSQNSHRIWQTMLQNPYIIFESHLGIIIPEIQGCVLLPRLLFTPKLLPVLRSLYNAIMNISLFGSKSTFGVLRAPTLREENIPF